MVDKDAEYIELQDDNHGHGYRLPKIEDHVGEELQCEAEVTQEHVRQLREIVVRQSAALVCAMNALDDLLPNGDARVGKMAQCLDFDLPWIK
jgi:hypothetical protein